MKSSIYYQTNSGNHYVYDDQKMFTLLVHPDLVKHAKMIDKDDSYYHRKYLYLEKHGFFGKRKPIALVPITEDVVKSSIGHTQQIVYEITDSCNLNCFYCGYGSMYDFYDKRENQNLNIESAIKLLEYVYSLKIENGNDQLYIGFYGGEPLLNMSFIVKIIETAKNLNKQNSIQIDYSMTTNGTLLHKYMDYLVANSFSLLISLDGNEQNHSYRIDKNGQNSFNKVIENIELLRIKYPEFFKDKVQFNAVLHNRNSAKDIYEFIFKQFNPHCSPTPKKPQKTIKIHLFSDYFCRTKTITV